MNWCLVQKPAASSCTGANAALVQTGGSHTGVGMLHARQQSRVPWPGKQQGGGCTLGPSPCWQWHLLRF